jgi:DNA-binding NarL/FixJ family response regulator
VIRLLLVGDGSGGFDSAVLRSLHEAEPGALEVVGRASTVAEACARAVEMKPDVVLLDLDTLGVDVVKRIASVGGTRVLVVATQSEALGVVRAGARGMVPKSAPAAVLYKALRKVREGELWLDRATSSQLLQELIVAAAGTPGPEAAERLRCLTEREREVVRVMMRLEGATGKALAKQLGMSEQTLRNHFSAIYRKLGIPNRSGLVALVSRMHLGQA